MKMILILLCTIFHTGIRPGELLKINLGMIDLVADEFIPQVPLLKNGTARSVPINKYLKNTM
jgi:integrase